MDPWVISILVIIMLILSTIAVVFKGRTLSLYYFRCRNCHDLFKLKSNQVMFEAHFGEIFIIKCPHCGKRGEKRIIVKDKNIIHEMSLYNESFNLIDQEIKTIEMRLNDEKRQLINIGDKIIFTNKDNNKQLVCLVEDLFYYNDFIELYNNHDKKDIGYLENEKEDPSDMLMYYTEEQIEKYKVVGIKIRKL